MTNRGKRRVLIRLRDRQEEEFYETFLLSSIEYGVNASVSCRDPRNRKLYDADVSVSVLGLAIGS